MFLSRCLSTKLQAEIKQVNYHMSYWRYNINILPVRQHSSSSVQLNMESAHRIYKTDHNCTAAKRQLTPYTLLFSVHRADDIRFYPPNDDYPHPPTPNPQPPPPTPTRPLYSIPHLKKTLCWIPTTLWLTTTIIPDVIRFKVKAAATSL